MLAQLKRASRRYVALVWAMAVVFALAPGISVALAVPAGAFSRLLVHAHAHGDDDHMHHGHHHYHGHHHHHGHHQHDHDGQHHHDDATDDGTGDHGQQRLHVHHDASCPSVLMPEPIASLLHRIADPVTILSVDAKQGAPPGRLLRSPIPAL